MRTLLDPLSVPTSAGHYEAPTLDAFSSLIRSTINVSVRRSVSVAVPVELVRGGQLLGVHRLHAAAFAARTVAGAQVLVRPARLQLRLSADLHLSYVVGRRRSHIVVHSVLCPLLYVRRG